jgi:hypothetical protein
MVDPVSLICDHGYGSHADGKACRADVRRLRDECSSIYAGCTVPACPTTALSRCLAWEW